MISLKFLLYKSRSILGIWGPFLIISPASTLHNWQQELEKFAPDFKIVPYWGSPNVSSLQILTTTLKEIFSIVTETLIL